MAWPKDGPNHKPAKGFVEKPASGIPATGAGLHGPANGLSPEFSAQVQPPGEAKAAGRAVAQEIRERIAMRKNEIVDRMIENALHGEGAQSNQAGMYLINQIAGSPAQSVDVTSDGGPLTVVLRRFSEDAPPA